MASRLEDYAVIGDGQTPLVSKEGSIEGDLKQSLPRGPNCHIMLAKDECYLLF
jgi:hypothetical protein